MSSVLSIKLATKRRFSAAPPLARCRSVCSPSAHPHAFDPRDAALARPSACMRKRASLFFEFFPYGCPEPVLVKRSLLVYKMASPKRSHELFAPELGGDAISPHLRERSAFECFPYVCPEPVLVKWSSLLALQSVDGPKRPFSHTYQGLDLLTLFLQQHAEELP